MQVYPDYIGLPDAPHLPGDLSIVAGSRLIVGVKSNKPLKSTSPAAFPFNRIHLAGSEVDVPLDISPSDRARAQTGVDGPTRGIPLPPGTNGLSVFLVDENGFETKDPTVYHIEIVPDKPPRIRVTSSDALDQTITRGATQHIEFDAADDYAVGRVSLRYTVEGGDMVEVPITLPLPRPKSISSHVDFSIAALGLRTPKTPGERITIQYWLYAEDLNTVSTPDHLPSHDQTDKYTLEVVTDEQKRQELMTKFSSTSDQINSITTQQQQGSSSLGQTIIRGTDETPEPTTRP